MPESANTTAFPRSPYSDSPTVRESPINRVSEKSLCTPVSPCACSAVCMAASASVISRLNCVLIAASSCPRLCPSDAVSILSFSAGLSLVYSLAYSPSHSLVSSQIFLLSYSRTAGWALCLFGGRFAVAMTTILHVNKILYQYLLIFTPLPKI